MKIRENYVAGKLKKMIAMTAVTAMLAGGSTSAMRDTIYADEALNSMETANIKGITLADGTVILEGKYEVPVSLKKLGKETDDSMAAGALASTGIMEVSEGTAKITLTFQTIYIMTCYGNLDELYFFDSYEDCVNANAATLRHNTEIFTYREDGISSGFGGANREENLQKPEKIQFILPYTDSQYVYLPMVVDVMTMLGMSSTEAALKIDYSNLIEIVDKQGLTEKIAEAKTLEADSEATQTQVNAQIIVLENTITGLAKEMLTETLSNGIYEVSVALWHASKNQASMAASSIDEKAQIVAKDGVYTMRIFTKEMTMGTIVANLQELKVYYNNTDYVEGVVEKEDEEGNPTEFSFVMPSTAEFLKVAVNPHVAIMGNADIDARLKIDYATLKDYVETEEVTTEEETNANVTTNESQTTIDNWTIPATGDTAPIAIFVIEGAMEAGVLVKKGKLVR